MILRDNFFVSSYLAEFTTTLPHKTIQVRNSNWNIFLLVRVSVLFIIVLIFNLICIFIFVCFFIHVRNLTQFHSTFDIIKCDYNNTGK